MELVTNLSKFRMNDMTNLHKVPATELGFREHLPIKIRPHSAVTKKSTIVNFQFPPNLTADLVNRNCSLVTKYKVVDESNNVIVPGADVSCVNWVGVFALQKFQMRINGHSFPRDGGGAMDVDALFYRLRTQYEKSDHTTWQRFMGMREEESGRLKYTTPQKHADFYCKCNHCPCLMKEVTSLKVVVPFE